jgi:L-ascorbate metabolism protein UlaG (beta-lactamase superfamily)
VADTVKKALGRRWVRIALAVLGLFALLLAVFAVDAWTAMGTRAAGERLARMHASPEWKDGEFANTIPTAKIDAWTATARWVKGGDFTTPKSPPPAVKPADFTQQPGSGLRITWFGHSSLLIEIDGRRFLTDPVWSDRCSPSSFTGPKRFFAPPLPLDRLPPLDAVVISHDHYDHLDEPTIARLKERVPRFFVPLGVGAHFEYWGVPREKLVELDWWGSTNVLGIQLTATPARHFSGRSLTDANQTLWAGWAFQGPAHRVFFSGDTSMFPGFAEIGERLGPFDAALIEVGAYDALWADVHLGPEQAVTAHRMLRGGVMFPVHWGTFDLALHGWTEPAERLLVAARSAGVTLVVPKPGESIEPAHPPAAQRWWPEQPWKTAAEHPVVSSGLAGLKLPE